MRVLKAFNICYKALHLRCMRGFWQLLEKRLLILKNSKITALKNYVTLDNNCDESFFNSFQVKTWSQMFSCAICKRNMTTPGHWFWTDILTSTDFSSLELRPTGMGLLNEPGSNFLPLWNISGKGLRSGILE